MTLGQLALHVVTMCGSLGKVCMRLFRLPALAVVAAGITGPLFAQAIGPFDVSRAFLPDSSNPYSSSRMFYPFYVTRTQPLSEAVREKLVHDGTPLLILDHPAGRIALATEQLTFHHIAQGDIDGEPWMVSF